MILRFGLTRVLLAAVLGCCVLLAQNPSAVAQTPTPTTETPTATAEPEVTPGPGDESDSNPSLDGSEFLIFTGMVLGLGVLAAGCVLLYLFQVQKKFYETSERMAKSGISLAAVQIAPFAGPGVTDRAQTLVISGPGQINVGEVSSEFSVTDSTGKTVEVTWSVSPETAVIVPVPGDKSKTKILATLAGAVTVTASTDEGVAGTAQAVAVKPTNSEVSLPFIGGGYGSIALAILLISAVIVLARSDVLGSEAVATFIGGLLGYVFGVTRTGSSGKGEED